MKIFKSHFWYSKSQRNGVLFLMLLIIVLQLVYFFVDFTSDEIIDVKTAEIVSFEKKLDSLKILKEKNSIPKTYPFNPNYITDYKGYKLGMTLSEIDRLHLFRKQNKFINSIDDFKKVTKVSDSLLNVISPYFKFPDWVLKKPNKIKNTVVQKQTSLSVSNVSGEKKITVKDINVSTAEDFREVIGIGDKLSKRIVKYRKKLQGFSFKEQVYEVWGLEPKVVEELLTQFVVIKKPVIHKININTASFKEVLNTPYVDYDLCKMIFDYRDEVAEFYTISELKKIEGFPLNKYERIVLYLDAN